MPWENVYIFISSTFNDMHAERDYLVKRVFPQLSAWCEERKLRLVDIDLRWGVSETDATENKRVVQVCLDRIDACRPFFLCLLGQRRGWVPDESDIDGETCKSFPKLLEKHYRGSASVTEMEILHALIDPLHHGILRLADGKTQAAEPVDHALFFLRDPGYLKEITNPDTRKIYTNESEAIPTKADAQLKRWREEVIPKTGQPIFDYSARWQESEHTQEIALPLYVPTTAPIGSDAWNAALSRWAKTWETVGVNVGDNGEITDGAELAKAKAYNERLTKGRLGNFSHNGIELAEVIIEQLKAAITERFGERAESTVSALQHELDQQAQLLQVASEGFIERTGDFEELYEYLADEETKPFALAAYAGMGKTSLLAHFIDTWQVTDARETLHYRFIGGSDNSVSVESLLRSLLNELKETGKVTSDIPVNTTDMLNKLPELLAEAGQNGKTILIIDALNQLETGLENLSWIPIVLPEKVKMIVSFKRGYKEGDEYYAETENSGAMLLHNVRPFDSMDDRKKVVTAYLEKYFKELDEPRVQALISAEGAKNPLFLKIVLAELRVFGVHNNLSAMVTSNFGHDPLTAFDAMLSRMERDPAYSSLSPRVLLPHVFGWLSHSKHGLSVDEMSELLVREGLANNLADAHDAVYFLVRQLRPYLAKRDGRIDFFYESFKLAAQRRYSLDYGRPSPSSLNAAPSWVLERYKTDPSVVYHKRFQDHDLIVEYTQDHMLWHKSLAEYFETLPSENRHKFMEQVWQYVMAGMDTQYQALLWSYEYLDACHKMLGITELLEQFRLAETASMRAKIIGATGLDDTSMDALLLLREGLQLSAGVLIEDSTQLASQLWGRLSGLEVDKIKGLLRQAEEVKQRRGEIWLRARKACLSSPASYIKGIYVMPDTVTDAAFADDHVSIDVLLKDDSWKIDIGTSKIRRNRGRRELETTEKRLIIPVGECRLERDAKEIRKVAVSGNACVWTYNIASRYNKFQIDQIKASADLEISDFAVTKDGGFIFCALNNGAVEQIDTMTGKRINILINHNEKIAFLKMSDDGRYLLTYGSDHRLVICDIERVVQLRPKDKVFYGAVNDVAVTRSGNLIAIAAEDGCLRFVDPYTLNIIVKAAENKGAQKALAVDPDGTFALSAAHGIDHKVMLWNLETGKSRVLGKHAGPVDTVALSSDGTRGFSASRQGDIKLWHLPSGHQIKTYEKKDSVIVRASLSPDGECAVIIVVRPLGPGSYLARPVVIDTKTGETLLNIPHQGYRTNALFSPCGNYVLSSSSDDKSIKIWEYPSGALVRTIPAYGKKDLVKTVRMTMDQEGRYIFSVNVGNSKLQVWDFATGEQVADLALENSYSALACSADAKTIAVGSTAGNLAVVSLENSAVRQETSVMPPKLTSFKDSPPSLRVTVSEGKTAVLSAEEGSKFPLRLYLISIIPVPLALVAFIMLVLKWRPLWFMIVAGIYFVFAAYGAIVLTRIAKTGIAINLTAQKENKLKKEKRKRR
jgi:WD40 repeat protein